MEIADVNQELIIDKLFERLEMERAAFRLYGAALDRVRTDEALAALVPRLEQIRRQEKDHEELIEEVLRRFGRDPNTGTTIGGLAVQRLTAPLLELAADPDLPLRGVLDLCLRAELLDAAGWELLEDLCAQIPFDEDVVRAFRSAERTEKEHVHFLREHVIKETTDELNLHQDLRPGA